MNRTFSSRAPFLHRPSAVRHPPWPAVAAAAALTLLAAPMASAAPVSINYLKDAKATNTSSTGSQTPNIFFSTPFAGVPGPSFTQASETVSASGGGATSSTTYEASIAAGTLRAGSSSSTTGTFSGTGGLGTSAEQILRISDTLTATGGTVGSTVSLSLTLDLDSILTFYNVPTASGTLCNYGAVSLFADINNSRVAQLGQNLCAGGPTQTITAAFNAVIGTDFELSLSMDILTQASIGSGNPFGSGVTIDALHTGKVSFVAPTGVQLRSSSGYAYAQNTQVPEPGSLALVAAAVLCLPLSRRLRPGVGAKPR